MHMSTIPEKERRLGPPKRSKKKNVKRRLNTHQFAFQVLFGELVQFIGNKSVFKWRETVTENTRKFSRNRDRAGKNRNREMNPVLVMGSIQLLSSSIVTPEVEWQG